MLFSARKLLAIGTGSVRLNELNRGAERRPCGTVKTGDGSIWNPLEQQLTACIIVTDLSSYYMPAISHAFYFLTCPHKHCRRWVLVLLPFSIYKLSPRLVSSFASVRRSRRVHPGQPVSMVWHFLTVLYCPLQLSSGWGETEHNSKPYFISCNDLSCQQRHSCYFHL